MNWHYLLQNGLQEVAQYVMDHTKLPERSAQIVSDNLHTFMVSKKTSQAKCQLKLYEADQ